MARCQTSAGCRSSLHGAFKGIGEPLLEIQDRGGGDADPLACWHNLVGTGTQAGARLSFHSGSHTGPVLATATVTAGAWTIPGTNTQPPGGKLYIWSDHGYVGEITVAP
jgi:hypothetical protein